MPYVSNQQRKFFNSPGAKKAGITKNEINEFNESSKGLKLPKFSKMKKALKEKK